MIKRVAAKTSKSQAPFRLWLNEQKRDTLTYASFIRNRGTSGWTIEDFYLESRARGLPIGMWAAIGWEQGSTPRNEAMLVEKFPGVRF